ncbi:MAG: preprotein translocase subunit SecG [Fibrobacterota bacterium]
MFGFLIVVFVIVCLLLGLFVLVQSDTGGGISGAVGGGLSGANSAIGAQNTENILTKGTTFLAIIYFMLALTLFVMSSSSSTSKGILDTEIESSSEQNAPEQSGSSMGTVTPEDLEGAAEETDDADNQSEDPSEPVVPEVKDLPGSGDNAE